MSPIASIPSLGMYECVDVIVIVQSFSTADTVLLGMGDGGWVTLALNRYMDG